MGIFDKFTEMFINTQKQVEESNESSFIKPNGTIVTEIKTPDGLIVQEKSPNKSFIVRCYNSENEVYMDYIRKGHFEIGHCYADNLIIYEYDCAYNNQNQIMVKNEKQYFYNNDNQKIYEIQFQFPKNTRIEFKYDETGNILEKIDVKGAVKTYLDPLTDKPIKRVIDRGSGGLITEDID